MKIYLAGPVVTEDKTVKAQMEQLEIAIKNMTLPTEDSIDLYRPGKHKVPNAWGIDMATWGQCVFTMDVVAIDECDWMVLADYGRQATAGTSWEAGYAFAKGVKILVVQMPGVTESSLMTQGCAANICRFEQFIEGAPQYDTNGNKWQMHIELDEARFGKFFFERGRRAAEVILN